MKMIVTAPAWLLDIDDGRSSGSRSSGSGVSTASARQKTTREVQRQLATPRPAPAGRRRITKIACQLFAAATTARIAAAAPLHVPLPTAAPSLPAVPHQSLPETHYLDVPARPAAALLQDHMTGISAAAPIKTARQNLDVVGLAFGAAAPPMGVAAIPVATPTTIPPPAVTAEAAVAPGAAPTEAAAAAAAGAAGAAAAQVEEATAAAPGQGVGGSATSAPPAAVVVDEAVAGPATAPEQPTATSTSESESPPAEIATWFPSPDQPANTQFCEGDLLRHQNGTLQWFPRTEEGCRAAVRYEKGPVACKYDAESGKCHARLNACLADKATHACTAWAHCMVDEATGGCKAADGWQTEGLLKKARAYVDAGVAARDVVRRLGGEPPFGVLVEGEVELLFKEDPTKNVPLPLR